MDLGQVNALTGVFLGIAGVLTVLVGWLKVIRPAWRHGWGKVTAAFDSINGRPAIVDSITGAEIEPALPGIGVRMAHQEAVSVELAAAVSRLADTQEQHLALARQVRRIDDRVAKLEAAAVERVVTKVESAEAWRAVQAVAGQAPGETYATDPDPDGGERATPLEQPDLTD